MPTLRLGAIAPDFQADSTEGTIRFHEWIGNSWVSSRVELDPLSERLLTPYGIAGHVLLASW